MLQATELLAAKIADELNIKRPQVEKTMALLDDGATVPFIARYRKEVTGGLDDVQLRSLVKRLHYLRELEERRQVILQSIKDQEKLTGDLEKQIAAAETKPQLEDLYLPYRPKRRTKALIAKEAGLEPLAELLFNTADSIPLQEAERFINTEHGIDSSEAALDGARQIIMEMVGENAILIEALRQHLWQHGQVSSTKHKKAEDKGAKFKDYHEYQEPLKAIPSHRALALFRGRREGILQLKLQLPNDDKPLEIIRNQCTYPAGGKEREQWLDECLQMAWKVKIFSKLELELMGHLRGRADEEATRVFAGNLHDLLLAAPAGAKITLGLDPGIRTGVKAVVVDATGKLLDFTTIFPLAPQNDWHASIAELAKLIGKYKVELISIGNGTGSRETERLVTELMKTYKDFSVQKMVVSEAGASVYSASELASNEFPDLDVSLRGAASIARRLQDPLAELVKIDPKAIGVGQYQHDINQTLLGSSLDDVVEDCVNAVGVDLNMASASLLQRVAGLNESLAKNIVAYRDEHGGFKCREDLLNVHRMGEKTFQQAAGFLRIQNGENPLDASAVHPESYPLVQDILEKHQWAIDTIIGDKEKLRAVNAADFVHDQRGLPTIRDVLKELEKPGRDPRPAFRTAQFKEGIEHIKDLTLGMTLEGVVSNVTNFGAFVDVGVHQDGLVHISEMTNRFIDDPRSVVKAGDIVTVRVTEVDEKRKRVGLSMKLEASSSKAKPGTDKPKGKKPAHKSAKPHTGTRPKKKQAKEKPVFNTAMADALLKLKQNKGS